MDRHLKYLLPLLLATATVCGCRPEVEISSANPVNWEQRSVSLTSIDSLTQGSTYLSVYSQIFSQTEHRTHNLTVTVSMHNVSQMDTIYIRKAQFFNTKGDPIRTYFDKPIYIAPMETVQIIIDEQNQEGGTGANFVFDWLVMRDSRAPYFEAVMISTSGSQGISFTTQGVQLAEQNEAVPMR